MVKFIGSPMTSVSYFFNQKSCLLLDEGVILLLLKTEISKNYD